MIGRVQKVLQEKGFGFIKGNNQKEYFFHHSALKNKKFELLREGDEVEFEDSESTKGLRAEDVYVNN